MHKSSIFGVWEAMAPFSPLHTPLVEFWGCWNKVGINAAGITFNYIIFQIYEIVNLRKFTVNLRKFTVNYGVNYNFLI